MNPHLNYYVNQAASGLSGFQGIRYQKGRGIFDTLVKFAAPVAKFIGRHALSAGAQTLGDVISGDPLKEAAKKRFLDEGKLAGDEIFSRITGKQNGSGRSRRKTKRRKTIRKKKKIRRPKSIKRGRAHKRKYLF